MNLFTKTFLRPRTPFGRLFSTLSQEKTSSSIIGGSKIYKDAESALSFIKDGAVIVTGGFGICGISENSLRCLKKLNVKDLTFCTNTCGMADHGPGLLAENRQVKKFYICYAGENKRVESQYMNGEVALEFCPQGSLVEKMRAGSAGIPAFYTPTGVGTMIEDGGFPIRLNRNGKPEEMAKREKRVFDGREFLMEEAIFGDASIVKAYIADKKGNLRFRKTARNFNQDIAGAGKITVAEVEKIVDELPPEKIHVPGMMVDRVFKGEYFEHRIERITLNTGKGIKLRQNEERAKARFKIVNRILEELDEGMYINLGIGIPAIISSKAMEANVDIDFQCENGIVGMGPYPKEHELDSDLINAAKEGITEVSSTSYTSSANAFGAIRGQHIHATILGALQVSKDGDLANWIVPGKKVNGMGGAMDLVSCGSKVYVCMEHNNPNGGIKILDKCTLPLTGKEVISKLFTEKVSYNFMFFLTV
jgi:3-oxoacid CoA-transferase